MSLQTAVLIPLFLLVIFAVIGFSLYGFAVSSAQSAAAACAETARALTGTSSDGQAAAEAVLASADSLTDPAVSIDRGATITTCTVRGSVMSPLPGAFPPIERSVRMPTERITQP